MTLNEFLSCDELEQLNALWRAELVAETKEEAYTYSLYKLDDFYVRVKVAVKDKSVCGFECLGDKADLLSA
ncbi:hypothetical protein [Niabella beijingensis]|uniref:hypothetical protein n=1 Tax=Niabella beijingensis TaxID=2872700 RepID=UPI001CBAF023|nr:hypothetical protein [Niabella beijingensis]MBZ4190929.1 hypothetical protein [Niabella beijingensis]